jgi:hypothetical protein
METKDNRGTRAQWAPRFASGYANGAAVVLALMGFLLVYTSMDEHRRLTQLLASSDSLFGVSTRTVLLAAGLLHLVVSGAFLLLRDPMARGMMGIWVAWNYVTYWVGMAWLKAEAPYQTVQAVARKIGAQPNTLDCWWKAFDGFLLLGGAALLVLERRRLKHLKADAFLRQWRDIREAPPTPPRRPEPGSPPVAKQPTEGESSAPAKGKSEAHGSSLLTELRFSCPCCGQHIRCDVAYSGTPIRCPACRENIQVPQSISQSTNKE